MKLVVKYLFCLCVCNQVFVTEIASYNNHNIIGEASACKYLDAHTQFGDNFIGVKEKEWQLDQYKSLPN